MALRLLPFLLLWRGAFRMGGIRGWVVLLSLVALLFGCQPSGDRIDVEPPSAPSVQTEQQAIANLLDLYRESLLNEDIDRLQSLLAAGTSPSATQTRATFSPSTFRQALSDTFRSHTVLAHVLQDVVIAQDRQSATFIEVVTLLDAATVLQQSQVFRTTLSFTRTQTGDVTTFRIATVRRAGPLVEVRTPGLLVAGPPLPLTVRAFDAAFPLSEVEVNEPVNGTTEPLSAVDGEAIGTFISPPGDKLHTGTNW